MTDKQREEKLVEDIAKILWDVHKFESKSSWRAGWLRKPFPWAESRAKEIARELLDALRASALFPGDQT